MSGIVGHAGLLMGGSQVWTPMQLGLRDWFSPTSPATDDGGGVCSQWNSLLSSRHLVASSTGRPSIIAGAQNGLRALRFNGTSNFMTQSGGAGLFRNTSAGWVFMVFRKVALDGAAAERCAFFANVGTGTGGTTRFGVFAGTAADANRLRLVARRQDADSAGLLNADTLANTSYHMVLMQMDWANGDGFIQLDGYAATSNLALTSNGNTADTDSVVGITVGRLTATTPQSYANIELAELILNRDQLLGSGDSERMFGWAAHRWALTGTLNPANPYVSSPP